MSNKDVLDKRTAVRLDANILNKLKKIADKKGVAISILIRMWIIERLEQEERQKNGN